MRPLSSKEAKAALPGDLLTVLLAPYDDLGAFIGRIHASLPRVGVGEATATVLALVIHELATNSLKYGALSTEAGTLDVSCVPQDNEMTTIIWTERGGPPVTAPVGPRGFGGKLLARSLTSQLGGSIDYHWDEKGVIVTLRMSKLALVA